MNKLREYGKQFRDRFWDLYYRLGLRRVSYSGSLGKRMVLQYFLSLLGVAVGTAVVALLVRIYLGFIGAEFKTERKILLRNLSGNSAFKSGDQRKTA